MSADDFQLFDELVFDNSILKRDFSRLSQQPGANLYDFDNIIDSFFEETNNYYEIGNAYLHFGLTLKMNLGFLEDDYTGTIKFTYTGTIIQVPKKATIMKTVRSEIEQNKYVGRICTILRVLTNKVGHISTYFDTSHDDKFDDKTLKEVQIDKNTIQDNKGKIFSQLALEHFFGFCNTIKKVTMVFLKFE